MKKIIILVIALTVLGGFLFWKFGPALPNLPFKIPGLGQKGLVSLTFWGLWEEEELMKPVIELYKNGDECYKV